MNNFENKIKNRLKNYNSEIDPYEIWDDIQAKLNKKKKRRWGFIWLAASVLLFMSIVYMVSSKQDSPHKKIVKTTTRETGLSIQKMKNIEQIQDHTQAQNYEKGITTNINRKMTFGNTKTKGEKKSGIKENIISHLQYPTDVTDNTLNHKEIPTAKTEKKQKLTPRTKNDNSTNFENKFKSSDFTLNSYLPVRISYLKYIGYSIELDYKPIVKNYTPKIFFNKKPTPEISIAFNYIHNNYLLSKENSKKFMQNVMNNEKQLESFDVFFGYNIPIYKKFSFYTGLNYGQIDSKLEFTYTDRQEVILDSALTKVVVKSLTDTLRIYERAKTIGDFKIHDIKFNYKRYLRVPILIAFSSNIKTLKYEIRTGIDFNILTCNNAKAITPKGKTIALDNTIENLRRKNFIGDFHLDIRLQYSLKNKLLLTFGPQYKVSLLSLMQENAGFDIYRHSFGLNIGAKYKI